MLVCSENIQVLPEVIPGQFVEKAHGCQQTFQRTKEDQNMNLFIMSESREWLKLLPADHNVLRLGLLSLLLFCTVNTSIFK